MRKISLTNSILLFFAGLLLGAMGWASIGPQLDWLWPGGGLVAGSPDGKHGLDVMANRHKVFLRAGPKDAAMPIVLSYDHDAPNDLYFREQGNSLEWSTDSTEAVATYRDIFNGREQQLQFRYRINGTWELRNLGPATQPHQPAAP